MVHVTFLPRNISVPVQPGTTLLQAMIAAVLHPDAPCGGKGTCGKCRVLVGGETVLACKTIADRDMTVTIPESDDVKILTAGISGSLRADGSHEYAAAFDIGKNLVAMMIESAGFEVIDLGVDVPAEKFVAAAAEDGVVIVACSALLTTTMPALEATVAALKAAGKNYKIMVGGAPINQEFADKVGADAYTADAASAAKKAKELVG